MQKRLKSIQIERIAAIHTGPNTHLDHLAPLAAWLGIQLLISDEGALEQCREIYPEVTAHLCPWSELSPFHLAAKFDVLLGCGKFWAAELLPLFKLLGKKMRLVFCPHGTSDKGHSLSKESHPPQDIALFYGDQLRDLWQRTGALSKMRSTVRTGNYRYPFYLEHRAHFDALAERKVFCRMQTKKQTILYAPTWLACASPSPFFSSMHRHIEELSSRFNLVVKLHPLLLEHHPAHTIHAIEAYREREGVFFVEDFPPIYPLLARSDIYLGDFSSIGYDFLLFDRPLYFLSSGQTTLQQCGMCIAEKTENIGRFIEETLEKNRETFREMRKSTYTYAFGKERRKDAVLSELLAVC